MELPTPQDLRERRTALDLTQSALAEMAGVSQPLIARIEGGDVDPRLSTLRRIVAALDEARDEHDDLPSGEFGTGRTLWRVDSHFLAGDTVAYYEALREALSAHDPFVDAVAAVLEGELPDCDPFERD